MKIRILKEVTMAGRHKYSGTQDGLIVLQFPHQHTLITQIRFLGRANYFINYMEHLSLLYAPDNNAHWNYEGRRQVDLLFGKNWKEDPYQNFLNFPYSLNQGEKNLLYWRYGNSINAYWHQCKLTVWGTYF